MPGVSFQAVVDAEDAHSFFSAQELERLRRYFVPGHGPDSADDTVPAEMLAQLRVRISIRRDRYSRSLITGEPMSASDDDGLGEGVGGSQHALPLPLNTAARRAPVDRKPGAQGGDVYAAVQAAVANAQQLAARGESGASVIDGGLKRARGPHASEDNAMLNYNPSLVGGEDLPSPAPSKTANTHNASSPAAAGAGAGADADAAQSCRDVAAATLGDVAAHAAQGAGAVALGAQGVGGGVSRAPAAKADTGDDEYVGWVGAEICAMPGAHLRAFDGVVELLRCAGFLQVVTEAGVALGNVEPRQAKVCVCA